MMLDFDVMGISKLYNLLEDSGLLYSFSYMQPDCRLVGLEHLQHGFAAKYGDELVNYVIELGLQ